MSSFTRTTPTQANNLSTWSRNRPPGPRARQIAKASKRPQSRSLWLTMLPKLTQALRTIGKEAITSTTIIIRGACNFRWILTRQRIQTTRWLTGHFRKLLWRTWAFAVCGSRNFQWLMGSGRSTIAKKMRSDWRVSARTSAGTRLLINSRIWAWASWILLTYIGRR